MGSEVFQKRLVSAVTVLLAGWVLVTPTVCPAMRLLVNVSAT
jgi:hypothetical protein